MASVSSGDNIINKPQGPTLGEVDTLACVYCRASVHFVGLPATRYVEHLFKEHNILYDVEYVVQRTLSLKNETLKEKQKTSSIGVQVNFDSYPVAFYKNLPIEKELIVKLKREEFKVDPEYIKKEVSVSNVTATSSNENNEAVPFKEVRKKLPWYAGCEYVCRECDELYFYSEELRKHIKDEHGDPDEYLDKHDKFETKAVLMPCLECNKNIKRHFNSILMHLRNHHKGMTMEEYRKKFKVPAKYEISVKIPDKTLTREKDTTGKNSAADDPSRTNLKRRTNIESNLPQKVTRSRSHLSTSEDEIGSLKEGANDKEDVPEDVSTVSETDKEEETKVEDVCPRQPITSDSITTAHEATTMEMSKYNNALNDNLLENGKSVSSVELDRNVALSSESETVPSWIENKATVNSDTPWYSNGCEYVCQECNTLFDDHQKLTTHLRSYHPHISSKQYFKKYRNSCVKATFYSCKLCKVRLKLQLSTLRKHLSKAHHVSMKDYTKRFHKKNILKDEDCAKAHALEDNLQSEHLDNQLYNEWIKGSCQFKCQICDHQFNISSKLWAHVKEAHSKTVKEYKVEFGDSSCLTPSSTMECHGCFKVIRHDTAHIRRHAKLSHGMSSKTYFMSLCNVEHLNEEENTKEDFNGLYEKNASTSDSHTRDDYLQWINRCIYTCHLCQKEFMGDMGLYNHVRATHDKNFTTYKDRFGSSMSKKVVFECPLCHAHILHNLKHLTAHVKLHNNMKLFDFYVQYIAINGDQESTNLNEPLENEARLFQSKPPTLKDENVRTVCKDVDARRGYEEWSNMSKFKCKVCTKTFLNPLSLGIHIRVNHKLSKHEYKQAYESHQKTVVFKHKCRICNTYVNQTQIVLAKHLKRHQISVFKYYTKYIHNQITSNDPQTAKSKIGDEYEVSEDFTQYSSFDEWANATRYGCKICNQFECRNYVPLISHLKRLHQLSKAKYTVKHGSLIIRKIMHKCSLCSSLLQQSYNTLYNHLNEEHQVNVHDYYSTYIHPSKSSGDKCDKNPIVAQTKKIVEIKRHNETEATKKSGSISDGEKRDGFHSWVNSCTFQCKICSWKTNIKSQLVSHIKEMHEMDITSYKKDFGSGFFSKVYHTCGICDMKVLCCVEMLTLHLKAHGISPFQYYEDYIAKTQRSLNYQNLNMTGNGLDMLSEDSIVRRSDVNITKSQENMFTNRFNRKEAALNWSSGCTYQCQICNRIYSKSNSFYLHLKVSHNTFTEEYRAKFGSFRTNTVFHECLICKNKIIHTTNLLRNHLKTHNMSMTDYYWEYVCASSLEPEQYITPFNEASDTTGPPNPDALIQSMLESCTYTPPQKTESVNPLLSNKKSVQPQSVMDLLSTVTPIISTSQLPLPKLTPALGIAASNVPITETVMQWASQCIYNCKICGKDYNRSNSFYLHLRMSHSTTPDEYRHQYKALRSLTVYHACLICGSNLVQTPCLMRKHFKSHGCSLQDYYIRYIQNTQDLSPIVAQRVEQKPFLKMNARTASPTVKSESIQPLQELNNQDSSHDELALVWANKYASACHICKQSYSRNSNLLKHIRVVHKMEVVRYREQYGINPPIIYHECCICRNPCAHTYPGLTQHLDQHDITLAAYHQKYIAPGFSPLSVRSSKSNAIAPMQSSATRPTVNNMWKSSPKIEENEQQSFQTEPMELQPDAKTSIQLFSTWKDACVYGCKMCDYSTKLRRFMMEHIKSVHNTSTSTYLNQFGTLETKSKYHNCFLCQSPILQDSVTLHTHLYHSHKKITVKEYYEKFIENSDVQSKQTVKDIKKEVQTQNLEQEKVTEHPQQTTGDAWSWANQCVYGCKICGKTFQLGNSFYKHIKVSHAETTASYLAKYKSLRSSTKMHNCQICGKGILQTAEHLKFHLRTHDNLSLEDYHHQYILQNASSEIAPSLEYEVKHSSLPVQSARITSEDVFEEDLVVESDDDYNDSNDDDNEEDPVEKWMNQCMFRCNLCKSQVRSKLEFCQHLMDEHNTNFDDYSDFYGNPMIILKRHSCLICKVPVPFDAEEIQTHLYKHHSLLPHQYYYNHVATNNEKKPQKEVLNVKGLKSISITRISKPSETSSPKNSNLLPNSNKPMTKVPNPLLKPTILSTDFKCSFEWNQCSEVCKICDEKYANFDGTIYLHINKAHQSELSKNYHMSDYIEKKIIYHTCFICDTDLEFRKTEIVRHLKSNHSTSINDYEIQFKDELEDIFEHLNLDLEDENLEYPPEYLSDNENQLPLENTDDMGDYRISTQTNPQLEKKLNRMLNIEHTAPSFDYSDLTNTQPIPSGSSSQHEPMDGVSEEIEGGIRIKVELDSSNEDEDDIDIDEFDINKI